MGALTHPEAAVLLGAVCPGGSPPDLPPADTDWLRLAQLAEREKLLGVLWPVLGHSADVIPTETAGAMRRQSLVNEFRMAALESRLQRVVATLDDQDIPVMLMKGAALAVTVYGSFARRPMGDLDLLVPQARAQEAWDALRGQGWTPELDDGEGFYDGHQHLCPLVAPGGAGVVVELHRCLLYPRGPFHLPERDVWASAKRVELGGRSVWVPAPHHMVLHLCIHFAWSHAMRRALGRTVRDLAALAPSVDWPRLVELAGATRSGSCCYWTLRLARRLGGASVPDDVLRELRPFPDGAPLDALERVIVADALDPHSAFTPSRRLHRLVWSLAIRPEAHGHGDVRPWTATPDFSKVVHSPPPRPLLSRLAAQLEGLPRWMRFIRGVVGMRS